MGGGEREGGGGGRLQLVGNNKQGQHRCIDHRSETAHGIAIIPEPASSPPRTPHLLHPSAALAPFLVLTHLIISGLTYIMRSKSVDLNLSACVAWRKPICHCVTVRGALPLLFSHHFTVLTSCCMDVCAALPLLFSHQVVWLCVERCLYCSHIKLYGCVWSVAFIVLTSSCIAVWSIAFTVFTSLYCSHITLLFSHQIAWLCCAWCVTEYRTLCMAVRGEIPLLFSHGVVWLCVE